MQLLIGFLLAATIACLAYRAHSLSTSGAVAAVVVGTIVFGLGGWQWGILLITFFISSSLLTRLFGRQKSALSDKFAKGGERDAGQVLANGGIASLFAGISSLLPQADWTWWAFAASLAAVNADTWSTEIGVLNPRPPRLITSGKPVEKGASGGVSLYGTLAALAGAGLIGVLSVLLRPSPDGLLIGFGVSLCGLAGSLFDSLLGASLQAIYRCPRCKKETERHPLHTCGTATVRIRGWKLLNNDWVNFACGSLGAGLMLLWNLL